MTDKNKKLQQQDQTMQELSLDEVENVTGGTIGNAHKEDPEPMDPGSAGRFSK